MPTYHHRSYPLKVPGSQHILEDMVFIAAVLPSAWFRILVDKLQQDFLFTTHRNEVVMVKEKKKRDWFTTGLL